MIKLKLKYTLPLLITTLLCVGGVEIFYYFLDALLTPERTTVDGGSAPPGSTVSSTPAEESDGDGEENLATASKDNATDSDPSVVVEQRSENNPKTDMELITGRNLFASRSGRQADKAREDPLAGVDLSSLAVTLMGTITGGDQQQRAIIYDNQERRQDLYQKGDFVRQAAIKKIMRGKVIINLNGKDEMLDIADAANVNIPRGNKPGVPITTAKRVTGRPVGSPAPAGAVQPNVIQQNSGSNVVIPQRGPRQLRSFRGGVIVKGRNTQTK